MPLDRNTGRASLLLRPLHLLQGLASPPRHVVGIAKLLQGIDRGVYHVVRVRSADALGQDVLDPGHFDDGTRRTASDDSGSGGSRP